jgi:Lipocalin-like domain
MGDLKMTTKVVEGTGWRCRAARRSDVKRHPFERWRTFMAALFIAAPITGASGQNLGTTEGLVGTWRLAVVDNVKPDGTRTHLYGPNPRGLLMLDRDGRYSLQITSSDRLKFAANDKSKGTPEEYASAIQGTNCHFGRYTINDADHSITLHVEQATFSNWEGRDLTWPFTLNGDESKFVVPNPTTGGPGVVGEIVWRRAH